jgi:hypothetical protein
MRHKFLPATCAAVVALGILSVGAKAEPQNGSCDLAGVESARSLREALSRRAVEIVRLAAAPAPKEQKRLESLVLPTAKFRLIAGDVGLPLDVGVDGARSLAKAMHADNYRFDGWNFMDSPTQPCDAHSVTMEFSDTVNNERSELRFDFLAGRLASAEGWRRSFEAGSLSN